MNFRSKYLLSGNNRYKLASDNILLPVLSPIATINVRTDVNGAGVAANKPL